MRNKYIPIIGAAVVILVIAGAVFWMGRDSAVPEQPVPPAGTATTTIYRNDIYGFSLEYPRSLVTTTTFGGFYILPDSWRVNPSEGEEGVGVIAIPVFRVDQGGVATGKAYPLYFSAEVRVGVSADPKAVADCLKTDSGYTTQGHHPVDLGGVQFEQFDFEDAAMMQYMQGASYRVVHNDVCFAVEQLRAGSSYRDETMAPGISDAQLDAYYAEAGSIVQTFRFTK